MGDERPLAVLAVAHYYPPHTGGLEVVVREVASELARRGHDVSVLTSACASTPGTSIECRDRPVVVTRVRAWNVLESTCGVPFPIFAPSLLLATWRLVGHADVVHIHDPLYISSWVTAAVCRLRRRPYVVTRHVGFVDHPSRIVRGIQSAVVATLGRFVLGSARSIIAISDPIAERSRRDLPGASVHVIPNGVALDRFSDGHDDASTLRKSWGIGADEFIALFVGRFVPKKGFEVVAAAADPRYRLVFAGGDRPDNRPDLADAVFLGQVPYEQMPAVYAAADVFVSASTGEGPMTVLEAMSSGTPVILRDDPGHRALGLSGPGAIFSDLTAENLRETLLGLAASPDGTADAGRQAHKEVSERESWQGHVEHVSRILRDAASR